VVKTLEGAKWDAAFGEYVVYLSLLGVHVGVGAYDKFVSVGAGYEAPAGFVALREGAKVWHVTEGEPSCGLLGVQLLVDGGTHAAMVGAVV
jgi:hypothetical protein